MRNTTMLSSDELVRKVREIVAGDQANFIKNRVMEKVRDLHREFQDHVENGDYDDLLGDTGLDKENLFYGEAPSQDEMLELFFANHGRYGVDYYTVQNFVNSVEDYKKDYLRYKKLIAQFEELL